MLALGAIAVVVIAGGDRGEPTAVLAASGVQSTPAVDEETRYVRALRGPVRTLGSSATSTGRLLAAAAEPKDIRGLARAASSQLGVVARARSQIASVQPPTARAGAHRRLLSAAATHRRFLALLVRASKLPPGRALTTLASVSAHSRRTLGDYRKFFSATPRIPNLVAGSGLGDLSGLRAALEARREAQRPKPPSTPAPEAARPPTSVIPAIYAGTFTSVDRLQVCLAFSDQVTCGSQPSGQIAQINDGYENGASYLGVDVAVDNGGPAMPMGTSFTTTGGSIRCDSSSRGITCTNPSTGAYFIIGDHRVRITNGAGGEHSFAG